MALIDNKKAYFNYEILEKLEAGIVLQGFEVKSVRGGHGSLEGSYVAIDGNEAYLAGANIPPYQMNNTPAGYDARRRRKLLLAKRELAHLSGATGEKGFTIVPLAMYNKGRNIKLEIGLARGKKTHDKRQTIKKREAEREISRTLKRF
jgi:SsrA-binding protein